jgi:hypothetical protein
MDTQQRTTSLFRDNESGRTERLHYNWIKEDYFPESHYIVYPNVALQVIIDSEYPAVKQELPEVPTVFIDSLDIQWDQRNFFRNSSVDVCVFSKSDYLAYVAFEIDGPSHKRPDRIKQDELKDLLFAKAGIPLLRLEVDECQTESEKRNNLEESIAGLKRGWQCFAEPLTDIGGRRVLCSEKGKEYFGLLKEAFPGDEYVVLPNVALQSIFPSWVRLGDYHERDRRRTGLVDFCVLGAKNFRPVVAFIFSEDELRQRVFEFFGLPLLDIRAAFEGGLRSSEDAVGSIQRRTKEALRDLVN